VVRPSSARSPAKKKAHQQLLAARARYERALAATDAAMLDAVSPPTGQTVLITNAAHDRLTADLRANHEAHTLVRQALTGSGDIDPRDGVLTIRRDPTQRATTAIAQLCEHLTATQTRYPAPTSSCATRSKPTPDHPRTFQPCRES
jgi:hypothetical protein